MKLIVGLGNPGKEYNRSRHNVGFILVDVLADKWNLAWHKSKFQGVCCDGIYNRQRVLLLKPQTYMNRSGMSVAAAMKFYKISASDLLVLVDDMALAPGRIRLRRGGSAGGHNGLKDIISHLGTEEFARLRVGIGTGPEGEAVNYVLGKLTAGEQDIIRKVSSLVVEAVECWLQAGIDEAMNRYNRKVNNDTP